jgi:hypothetical protein
VKLRIKEAISTGLLLCIALFIAGRLMSFDLFQFFTREGIVFIVGFIIGYRIPSWYRGISKYDKEPTVNEPAMGQMIAHH